MPLSRVQLDVVAWVLGVTALGLAILLRMIFQIPLPTPINNASRDVRIAERAPSTTHSRPRATSGVIEFDTTHHSAGAQREVPLICTILTNTLAVAGLIVGALAVWRDRRYALAGPAMLLCVLALLWHYVLFVYMTVVLIAVVILVLRMLLMG